MFEMLEQRYMRIDSKVNGKTNLSIYEILIALGCILAACLMMFRVFFGTELTDEAYYISDAIQMAHGNIPYAYNNFSYGTGSAFLIIPFVFIYELIVPNNEGVFLFTRICFVLFWYLCIGLGYRILKKDFKKSHALLVTGFMIPYMAGTGIYNFSYNSIPCALAYLSALTVYDAIEHANKYSAPKLIISGFILGIALFAHPGYALAIATLGLAVIIRSNSIKAKIKNFLLCVGGGIIEILLIFIPIIVQVGFGTLYDGIYSKFHPYPTGAMSSVPLSGKFADIISQYKFSLSIFIFIFIFVFVFSNRYICEKEKKLSAKNYALLGVSAAMFLLAAWHCYQMLGSNASWRLGFLGSIGIVTLFLFGTFAKQPILLYIGLYPIIFPFAQIIAVDSSVSLSRFSAAVPALAIYFLVMLENESELIRLITTGTIVGCILSMGLSSFTYIYRDDSFSNLAYRVESGVYKGIYTTETRARDLPELEEYLNSIVGEDELYAFRDNVPAGYLMMHNGTMIDKDTWDCLNYSYHKNAPNNLYTYYMRRGEFPRKYIYVDYGSDEKLSIEDESYKLNEFIKTYYEKIADFSLNDTFYHIVVYQYKGGFDGDFDYWIGRHMYTPETN